MCEPVYKKRTGGRPARDSKDDDMVPRTVGQCRAGNTGYLNEVMGSARVAFIWVSMMLKADCSRSSLLVLALSV